MKFRKCMALVFGLLLAVLTLTACGKAEEPAFPLEKLTLCGGNEAEPPSGVTMELRAFNGQSITLRLENQGGEDYKFEDLYHLDYTFDGQWYRVPFRSEAENGPAFDAAEYTLDSNGAREWTRDVAGDYGALPAGRYRLVKQLRRPEIGETHAISVEFTVK